MKTLEDILNNVLKEVQSGSGIQEAFSKWPEHEKELRPLVEMSASFKQLPKNSVPEPAMRRKYLTEPVKAGAYFAWLHFSRMATVSMSIIIFLAAFSGTAYGAIQSLPGETLFSVKKIAEQIHVGLTRDPIKKANIQVTITQKRLHEAEKVFRNPKKNPSLEMAALTELSAQTKETIETVKTAAASNSIQETDHPLVMSLETIAKEQQTLLNKIESNEQAKVATASTQEEFKNNADQITEIKKSIEIASAIKDIALAKLNPDPNIVTLSGTITNLGKDQVTVEKMTFKLTSDTVVKNSDSDSTSTPLSVQTKINIIGHKKEGSLIAQEITILKPIIEEDVTAGIVEGTATTSPQYGSSTPSGSATTSPSTGSKQPANEQEEETPVEYVAPKAVGTFILEDPSPQFSP